MLDPESYWYPGPLGNEQADMRATRASAQATQVIKHQYMTGTLW